MKKIRNIITLIIFLTLIFFIFNCLKIFDQKIEILFKYLQIKNMEILIITLILNWIISIGFGLYLFSKNEFWMAFLIIIIPIFWYIWSIFKVMEIKKKK